MKNKWNIADIKKPPVDIDVLVFVSFEDGYMDIAKWSGNPSNLQNGWIGNCHTTSYEHVLYWMKLPKINGIDPIFK